MFIFSISINSSKASWPSSFSERCNDVIVMFSCSTRNISIAAPLDKLFFTSFSVLRFVEFIRGAIFSALSPRSD
jgi:hypothetical protein